MVSNVLSASYNQAVLCQRRITAKQLEVSSNNKSGLNVPPPPVDDVVSVVTGLLFAVSPAVVTENEVVNAPTVTIVEVVPCGLPGLCVIIIRLSPFRTVAGVLLNSSLLST